MTQRLRFIMRDSDPLSALLIPTQKFNIRVLAISFIANDVYVSVKGNFKKGNIFCSRSGVFS